MICRNEEGEIDRQCVYKKVDGKAFSYRLQKDAKGHIKAGASTVDMIRLNDYNGFGIIENVIGEDEYV